MTKSLLLARALRILGGVVTLIACDDGGARVPSDPQSTDCPYGTFRPMGLADCVFPANDFSGQPIGVSDNRCAAGQPAIPPQCVSDSGGRPYLSISTTCAPGYRFFPSACNRNGGTAGVVGSTGGTGGPCPPGACRAPDGFCVSTGAAGATAGSGGAAGSSGSGGAG